MNAKSSCIACGYHVTHPYFYPGDNPLSVMDLAANEQDSQDLPRYPMHFNMCARCGHIFNVDFDPDVVPYDDRSNLMFNQGSGWKQYLGGLVDAIEARHGLAGKTCVEIGCGDGEFLASLAERGAKTIGFEPGTAALLAAERGVDRIERDYFVPSRHLELLRPHMLVSRHVLEHLPDPLGFVTEIAYWSNRTGVFPIFLVEVPRIDKAVEQGRVNDFLYEHVSNFSDRSFRMMFELAGFEVLEQMSAYGDEVLVGVVRPRKQPELSNNTLLAEEAVHSLAAQLEDVRDSVEKLRRKGNVAIWGGTGKGSAFLNLFGLDSNHFPIVVDSDPAKCGLCVPGTGQKIREPSYLNHHPVDSIVITSQWRARDIFDEIQRRGISFDACYTVVNRVLTEYHGEDA